MTLSTFQTQAPRLPLQELRNSSESLVRAGSLSNSQALTAKTLRAAENTEVFFGGDLPTDDQAARYLLKLREVSVRRQANIESAESTTNENPSLCSQISPSVAVTTKKWNQSDVVMIELNRYMSADLSSKDDETLLGTKNLGNNIAIIAMGFKFCRRTYPSFLPRINALAPCDGRFGSIAQVVDNLRKNLLETYGCPKNELQFVFVGPKRLLQQKYAEIKQANTNGMPDSNIIPISSLPEQEIDLVVEGDIIYHGSNIIEGENL